MRAFFFANSDKKLRYNDDRKIKVGTTHTVDGELQLCKNGLHASKRLIDALKHAPGHHLYLVDLDGEIIEGVDKLCSRSRKYIAHFDAENLLYEFARKQALINIEKIRPYCSENDYNTIVKWLRTGDKKVQSAAWLAAESARSAARSAAESAAESAAWSAAESAAESAAWPAESAAWLAAWSAWSAESAESAAWSAARSKANKMLVSMARKETGWDI